MKNLLKKLEKYNIEEAIKIESSDRQFIAIKKLVESYEDKNTVLSLVIANSIICYQLSWKWENYWEEFSEYFIKTPLLDKEGQGVVSSLADFIKQSKNNKRFIDTKVKRLEKLKLFLIEFIWKEEYYYKNMLELRNILAKTMKQKHDAKTIVFAVKMFSYAARNVFDFVQYPKEICVPIDSRLTNLFEKYSLDYEKIWEFYSDLSEKLNIPELHLDAIIWVNYDELIWE